MITLSPLNVFARIMKGEINLDTDDCRAILLNGLTFDQDTHGNLAAVTANQIATKNGYTQDTKALVNSTISEDTVNDLAKCVWDAISWTGDTTTDGTGIGPFTSMAFIDFTTATNVLILHVDFESTITLTDGVIHAIAVPAFAMANAA